MINYIESILGIRKDKLTPKIKDGLLITVLLLLISCYSTKSNVQQYTLIDEFNISNPSASFVLKQYPFDDNFFNADTIFVLPGTEIFFPDSITKEVIEKPTPFSPSTEFSFILANADSIKISINPTDSSFVKDVYSAYLDKGHYGLLLMKNEFESGVYWIHYRVGNQEKHRKFMLMR